MKLKLTHVRPDEPVSVEIKTSGTPLQVAETLREIAEKLSPVKEAIIKKEAGLKQQVLELQDALRKWHAAAKLIRCARCSDDRTVLSFDEYGFPARDICRECFELRKLQDIPAPVTDTEGVSP